MILTYTECMEKYRNNYQLGKAVAEECIYRVESRLYSTKRHSNEKFFLPTALFFRNFLLLQKVVCSVHQSLFQLLHILAQLVHPRLFAQNRVSPNAKLRATQRLHTVANRNNHIKAIKFNRFISICNVHFLHIALFQQFSFFKNISNMTTYYTDITIK